jgi:hypothetical protein
VSLPKQTEKPSLKWFSTNWIYNFESYDSLCIEPLVCQNLLVNDAVLRKKIREVVMLPIEVIKSLTWPVIDFAPSVVMETSLCNETLDFVTK